MVNDVKNGFKMEADYQSLSVKIKMSSVFFAKILNG